MVVKILAASQLGVLRSTNHGVTTSIVVFHKNEESVISNLSVKQDAIREVLNHESIADIPVAIFSVNGPRRSGKSFFLTQVLKYLIYGAHTTDWIQQPLSGFDWKGGFDSVTNGVNIWSKPFIISAKNTNQKLGLLLLDNQGLGEDQTSDEDELKLFCLSHCLSSIFTYCGKDLQWTSCFKELSKNLEFTKSVRIHEIPLLTKNGCAENAKFVSDGTLLLQWKDITPDSTASRGVCEFYTKQDSFDKDGCMYQRLFSTNCVNEDANHYRKNIETIHSEVIVSSLSGPGNRVPQSSSDTKTNWDEDFKCGLVIFITKVFSYEFLSQRVKKVNGEPILGKDLTPIFVDWMSKLSCRSFGIEYISRFDTGPTAFYKRKVEQTVEMYDSLVKSHLYRHKTLDLFNKFAIDEIETKIWTDSCCIYLHLRSSEFLNAMKKLEEHMKARERNLKRRVAIRKWKRIVKMTTGIGIGAAAVGVAPFAGPVVAVGAAKAVALVGGAKVAAVAGGTVLTTVAGGTTATVLAKRKGCCIKPKYQPVSLAETAKLEGSMDRDK